MITEEQARSQIRMHKEIHDLRAKLEIAREALEFLVNSDAYACNGGDDRICDCAPCTAVKTLEKIK